jgi:uncharacterized protein YigA (DUF484 family)
MEAKFQLAVELIDGEIEKLRKRLDALTRERAALMNGAAAPTADARRAVGARLVAEASAPLVLHRAIDRVLVGEAGHPISVKEVRERVLALPIKSTPSEPAVRGTLNQKAEEYGWRKTGSGRSTRWYKPRSGQEATS